MAKCYIASNMVGPKLPVGHHVSAADCLFYAIPIIHQGAHNVQAHIFLWLSIGEQHDI